jgi:hypothetical protein
MSKNKVLSINRASDVPAPNLRDINHPVFMVAYATTFVSMFCADQEFYHSGEPHPAGTPTDRACASWERHHESATLVASLAIKAFANLMKRK